MKELAYLWRAIVGLAVWIKLLLYLLVSGFVVAVAGYLGLRAALIATLCVLALGVFLVFFGLLSRWVRARKEAELRGEFESSSPQRPLVDPRLVARLEALRAAFRAGLTRFQVAGKDPYELPWFILAGEPGTGKTEAVRHAGIELPQDRRENGQGVGGTSLLDWWFTNYAVIIDTEGGLLFGPADAPVTPEWRELTDLLRRHRPHLPLNGAILTISTESLLGDSAAEVQRKAGIIARHFDTLSQSLGLRFPVFVAVTKCDLLPGFSPFFQNFRDEKARQQMLGWSNPAPLEAPFRFELIEEHFRILSQRLKRRRLGMLLDPSPRQPGGRRIDEVDTLFDLPAVLGDLLPNLRLYLDNIFVAGEWSVQPLFLRGVYLTSGMPGGASEAPGTTVGEVPETASFFLRDLLLDKVFREDSLVTSAGTGVRERLRRRLLLFGLGVLVLAGLMAVAFEGSRRLSKHIARDQGVWEVGASGWKNQEWNPLVIPGPASPQTFPYSGDVQIRLPVFANEAQRLPGDLSLAEYQHRLVDVTATPLPIPWIFRLNSLLPGNVGARRYMAQRVLFEGGVVQPLLSAARAKMSQPSKSLSGQALLSDAELAVEARALTELVRVEVDRLGRSAGMINEAPGADFVPVLLQYVSGVEGAAKLPGVMNWTYHNNPKGRGRWAPSWTSGGEDLKKNTAIAGGIDRLVAYATARAANIEGNLSKLAGLSVSVSRYSDAETRLAEAANIKDDWKASAVQVGTAFESLEAAKIQMEKQLFGIRAAGFFEQGPETLASALGNLSSDQDSHLGQVDLILDMIDKALPKPPPPGTPNIHLTINEDSEKYILLEEIKKRLTGVSELLKKSVKDHIDDKLTADYAALDQKVLEVYQNLPGYLWRWNAYQQCATAASAYYFQPSMYLVGERWNRLSELDRAIETLQASTDAYDGPQAHAFLTTCSYMLRSVQNAQTKLFVTNYTSQARDALLRVARFPLVWPPGSYDEALSTDQLQAAKDLLQAIAADLQVKAFTDLTPAVRQPAMDFFQRIGPLYQVVDALIKPDGHMIQVSVILYNGQAQHQLSGPNYAPPPEAVPNPTPPPRSMVSKIFFGLGSPAPTPPPPPAVTVDTQNWNAVSLVQSGPAGVFPLSGQRDTPMGTFSVQDPFSFQVYHSLSADDGYATVDGGRNWSAFRLMARLGARPLGVGQDWQVALKPHEPNSVWVLFSFEQKLPVTPWPTLESLGLRQPAERILGSADPDSLMGTPSP